MTDVQRIEVMQLVKSGELTVDQAMEKVMQDEEALRAEEPAAPPTTTTTAATTCVLCAGTRAVQLWDSYSRTGIPEKKRGKKAGWLFNG